MTVRFEDLTSIQCRAMIGLTDWASEFELMGRLKGRPRLAGGSVFSYVADPAESDKRLSKAIAAVQAEWFQPDGAT